MKKKRSLCAALLAGLVKGPTMYSPRRNPEN